MDNMRKLSLLLLLASGLSVAQTPTKKPAAELPSCSTEKVNHDCQLKVDRRYPIQLPTIQMRPKASVTVFVINPLPYETLTLDPGGAQGVAGTDQIAGFLTSAMPNLKQVIASNDVQVRRLFVPPPPPLALPPDEQHVQDELNQPRTDVQTPRKTVTDFTEELTEVYSELQEIVAPVPRPTSTPRPSGIVPKAPWVDNQFWRTWVLCELIGCMSPPEGLQNTELLAAGFTLVASLPSLPGAQFPAQRPIVNENDFKSRVDAITMDINMLLSDRRATYMAQLAAIQAEEVRMRTALGEYQQAISNVLKDLGNYAISIEQTNAQAPHSVLLGSIVDPKSVSPSDAAAKLLGTTVSFSVFEVNQVAASVASVPTSTKKPVVAINILFADPKLEASAEVFFFNVGKPHVFQPNSRRPKCGISADARQCVHCRDSNGSNGTAICGDQPPVGT